MHGGMVSTRLWRHFNPSSRLIRLTKKTFLMLGLSSTHYQLSNAPSLVPVLKAVLHNFTKQLNEVWWYSLDPVVTSLQPQLSPNPDKKKFFWGQIWVLLTIGFPTRHRLSLYEQQNSQCLKTVFCGVYALPTSPPNRPGLAYSLEILKSTALNQFFEFDNEQDCIWKLETCSIELNKN